MISKVSVHRGIEGMTEQRGSHQGIWEVRNGRKKEGKDRGMKKRVMLASQNEFRGSPCFNLLE